MLGVLDTGTVVKDYHNSVRKGEFLSFINSEWTFEHPSESATVS